MILYPAIDLKAGQCVRLVRGDMDSAKTFNSDPADQASIFQSFGFSWLHVVDLDGAFAGEPVNIAAVEAIVAAVRIPIQIGGGIRSMATIESWLKSGVSRVILGTAALEDPQLIVDACAEFPEKIVLGVDSRNGMVAVKGWAEQSAVSEQILVQRFSDAGVSAIIHTDINRDGLLEGANVAATAALAKATEIPVIASGGIRTVSDIEDLKTYQNAGIAGAVIGRALYDGGLDAKAALAAAA